MATTAEAVKAVQHAGTKISKEKVIDALRKATFKEIEFAKDPVSGYSLILIKLG